MQRKEKHKQKKRGKEKEMQNIMQSIEKACEKYERYKQKKHLNEKREDYERRKWKKRNDEYNRKNKKNTIFCYETSENKRYSINRGIHTIEYARQFMQDGKVEPEKVEKNKIILIYGKYNGKYQGILKLATKVKKLEMPEKMEIEGTEYKASDMKKILIEKNAMIFEM